MKASGSAASGASVSASVPASTAANGCDDKGVEKKAINAELWYACAGPLVTLPPVGSLVVYFPQGHSEQVAASMQKDIDMHVPNYPNLPSKLICLLQNVTLHADPETDEVYAQMILQPVESYTREALQLSELALKQNKPQAESFCKTLTASDTSTHGGFSVPRRAAEKIFPHLDFSMQPPAQELQAKDLHDNTWTFRHIYRGQPKRHLLTTGWSLFVSGKRLFAGDSVLFVRDEKQQLLLGIRRASRQPTNIQSSVLSSDSMHIGILAAAAHAAANHSSFTVFYNPRASPSEFVIPFAKFQKAVYGNQLSLGMRFRMIFETEELGTRRYMGTITGISDLDPVRWKNSQWRNLQVGWDESAAGEKRNRVSVWEIEPVAAPFFICPPPFFSTKRSRQPGMLDDDSSEMDNVLKRVMPFFGEEICIKDPLSQNSMMPGLSLAQWMSMQQNPLFSSSSLQYDNFRALAGNASQNIGAPEISRQIAFQNQSMEQKTLQFGAPQLPQQLMQVEDPSKVSVQFSQVSNLVKSQQPMDAAVQQRQLHEQTSPCSQVQTNLLQPQVLIQKQLPQNQLIQSQERLLPKAELNHMQHLQAVSHQEPLHHQTQPAMQRMCQQQQYQKIVLQQQQQQQPVQPQQQQDKLVPLSNLTNQQPQLSDQVPMHLLQKMQNPSLLAQLPQQLPAATLLPQQHISSPQTGRISQQSLLLNPTLLNKQLMMTDPVASAPSPTVPANIFSASGNPLITTGVTRSAVTDEVPSCSTSPSTNNGNSNILPQNIFNRMHQSRGTTPDNTPFYPAASNLKLSSVDGATTSMRGGKELPKLNHASEAQRTGDVDAQNHTNILQSEYLDATSTASPWLSPTEGLLQQNLPMSSFPHVVKDAPPDHMALNADNLFSGVNGHNTLSIPMASDTLLVQNVDSGKYFNNISENIMDTYGMPKDAQQEISSSMVSQSFAASDMAFNSIDSALHDGFPNRNSWATAPPLQRMRTYTKVYKRGAVGRSIDISRYSGYEELKSDLARMFSIEGQLEDRQRIGWKLVYKDHEDDILLVGDDPWEEFVSCVRCIRILSPQEVQQMSLDGHPLENNILPNQACSSSDGGNGWKGRGHQTSGNPSSVSFEYFE